MVKAKYIFLFIFIIYNSGLQLNAQANNNNLERLVAYYKKENSGRLDGLWYRERHISALSTMIFVCKFEVSCAIKIAKNNTNKHNNKLHKKYDKTREAWNLYLDTMISFVKDYPTLDEDFQKRNKLIEPALNRLVDFFEYYRKNYELECWDKVYKKHDIKELVKILTTSIIDMDFNRNEKIKDKSEWIKKYQSLYWEDWDDSVYTPIN